MRSKTRDDPRRRMIRSAALLMRERGVEATSFSDVIEHSGAPRGSIYHHFPGGKAQLVAEATEWAGDVSARGLVAALEDGDPIAAVGRFFDAWRGVLRETGNVAGCPVVAAAVEGDRTPGAREAAAAAFTRWEDLLAEAIAARGIEAARARGLATLVIAAMEGAVILARAQGSPAPLERVADETQVLLREALEQAPAHRPRGDRPAAAH